MSLLAFAVVDDLHRIAERSDPNGLAYDTASGTLCVADSSGAVLRVAGEQSTEVATLEAGGAIGISRLGGIALGPDAMYVTRIGNGTAGTIVRLGADGTQRTYARLDPQLWRLGVAHADGVLYATQFAMSKFGAHDGSIIAIDDAGGHTCGEPSLVIDGFHKPIGIAKIGTNLIVADARARAVYRVELVAGRARARYQIATFVDRPDSVCAVDGDSVIVTSFDAATNIGRVHRLWLDGRVCLIASGLWEPRGVAVDVAGGRVFVAARRDGVVIFAI